MPAPVVRSYKFWRLRWLFRLNRFSEAAITRVVGISFVAHCRSRISSVIEGGAACWPVTRNYQHFFDQCFCSPASTLGFHRRERPLVRFPVMMVGWGSLFSFKLIGAPSGLSKRVYGSSSAHRNSSAAVPRVRHCPPVIYSVVRFIALRSIRSSGSLRRSNRFPVGIGQFVQTGCARAWIVLLLRVASPP